MALPGAAVRQHVPRPPVDAVGQPAVAAAVVPSVQVRGQAGVEPPAGAVVLRAVARGVAVVVAVGRAEGAPVVVVSLAVGQRIARVARVLPRSKAISGDGSAP